MTLRACCSIEKLSSPGNFNSFLCETKKCASGIAWVAMPLAVKGRVKVNAPVLRVPVGYFFWLLGTDTVTVLDV
jgi:hypothetical protein